MSTTVVLQCVFYKLGFLLPKRDLSKIGGCSTLLYHKAGQLHVDLGPDKWPQGSWHPITADRALMASSSQMMPLAVQCASRPVLSPHCMQPAAWYHLVGSPHLLNRACEWSAEPVFHYTYLSACLAGHNDTACSHVLHASMTLTSVPWNHVSTPWKHAGVPSFILVPCDPQRTVRHMAVLEHSPTGRRGPEP
jgi:hypothetical protein